MAAIDPGPPRPTAFPHPGGVIPSEWPAQATDLVVDTIDKVRDRTTKPAIIAARGAVYGILGFVGAIITAVLVITFVVRLWDVYVPGDVWIFYALLAVGGTISGAILLKKANTPAAELQP